MLAFHFVYIAYLVALGYIKEKILFLIQGEEHEKNFGVIRREIKSRI